MGTNATRPTFAYQAEGVGTIYTVWHFAEEERYQITVASGGSGEQRLESFDNFPDAEEWVDRAIEADVAAEMGLTPSDCPECGPGAGCQS